MSQKGKMAYQSGNSSRVDEALYHSSNILRVDGDAENATAAVGTAAAAAVAEYAGTATPPLPVEAEGAEQETTGAALSLETDWHWGAASAEPDTPVAFHHSPPQQPPPVGEGSGGKRPDIVPELNIEQGVKEAKLAAAREQQRLTGGDSETDKIAEPGAEGTLEAELQQRTLDNSEPSNATRKEQLAEQARKKAAQRASKRLKQERGSSSAEGSDGAPASRSLAGGVVTGASSKAPGPESGERNLKQILRDVDGEEETTNEIVLSQPGFRTTKDAVVPAQKGSSLGASAGPSGGEDDGTLARAGVREGERRHGEEPPEQDESLLRTEDRAAGDNAAAGDDQEPPNSPMDWVFHDEEEAEAEGEKGAPTADGGVPADLRP